MASMLIRADRLSVGDVLLLPMGRSLTVEEIKPFGPRSVYVRFRTATGWTRVERDTEVSVQRLVPTAASEEDAEAYEHAERAHAEATQSDAVGVVIGLLEVARLAMPDTFWATDSRVQAARDLLGSEFPTDAELEKRMDAR